MRTQLISGDEVDAIEDKEYFTFRAGVRKTLKRKVNRRVRKHVRDNLRRGRYEFD